MLKRSASQSLITASLLSVCVGITLGQFVPPSSRTFIWAVLGSLAFWFALKRSRKLTAAILAACLALGFARGSLSVHARDGPQESTSVQNRAYQRLSQSLRQPDAALAAGLLTGDREHVSTQLQDDFRASGLSHVVAVSGYNVTLVVTFVLRCTRRMPRRVRLVVAIASVLAFVIVAGASAAVVRAGVMGAIGVMALHAGRFSTSKRALLLAATGMLLYKPSLVAFDVGFQLSLSATAALLWLGPRIAYICKRITDVCGVRTSLVSTLSATIGTLPLSVWYFANVPIYGLIANILVAPLIPLAMATSTVLLVLPASLQGPAQLAASGLLYLLRAVPHSIANWPFAVIQLQARWMGFALGLAGILLIVGVPKLYRLMQKKTLLLWPHDRNTTFFERTTSLNRQSCTQRNEAGGVPTDSYRSASA
jgi:ComEC/Rec2-related protein